MASNSIQGNWAAQARVFGHAAYFVAPGSVSKFEINATGSGYVVGDFVWFGTVALTDAFKVKVTSVDGTGGILGAVLVAKQSTDAHSPFGSGKTVGATIAQVSTSGSGTLATADVTEINLPQVEERGASLYIAIDLTKLEVVMESDELLDGGGTYTVDFNGVKAGSFLPILVKKVVGWTSASGNDQLGEIIALY